jgi:hypothetical protein
MVRGEYILIGDAYLHGMMQGEAMVDERYETVIRYLGRVRAGSFVSDPSDQSGIYQQQGLVHHNRSIPYKTCTLVMTSNDMRLSP